MYPPISRGRFELYSAGGGLGAAYEQSLTLPLLGLISGTVISSRRNVLVRISHKNIRVIK